VKLCAEHGVPVIAFGTGTSLEGHVNAPFGGVSIDMSQMKRVVAVHAEDLDCTVEAGVTRKELNEHLRDQGLFFPIDPGADASIGGMAATRASGTNAVRYGTMKDNVIALTAVMGDGSIVKTASRARKSSAGYDLTRLLVGSEGTLGIITEVTLKLHGIPEAVSAGVCPFPSVQAACDATIMTIQSGLPIARIELVDDVMMRGVNLHSKLGLPETTMLFVEFHGSEEGVKNRPSVSARSRPSSAAARSTGRPSRRIARSFGRRGTTPIGQRVRSGPARNRSRRMSACRSRGWPNASTKPRRTSRRAASSLPSSAMSATAISTSCR
jgi:D-lactate dehydrogenase (cytochrome)